MKNRKFPSFSQWKQIFKVVRGTERIFLLTFIFLALSSIIYLAINFYIKNTEIVPAYGGTFTEGIVGQPRFINPIYGETNDIDRTLIDLTYSGLMTYDKDGKLVNDLVKNYEIADNGATYIFELKDDLFWHNGEKLTADDVVYTIKTIQNSDYKSPLRANWLNVEIQKLSEKSFVFYLNSPYNSFLENSTVKIIPQHIWKNVLPENFSLSSYNLKPIGSGPYLLKELHQDSAGFITDIKLSSNPRYYDKVPYIPNFNIKFFNDRDGLVKAVNQKSINGFSLSYLNDDVPFAEKQIKQGWSTNEKFTTYYFSIPRYFAVFFNNEKPKIFSDLSVSKALNYSVDKNELINKINSSTKDNITIVDSPILPNYYNLESPTIQYEYNIDQAKEILEKAGYKEDSNGQRLKANDKQPAFQFKSYLKQGSKGEDVSELQSCLIRLDENFKIALDGETSGTYSKLTENTVTEFQKKYLPDLDTTGETGPSTRKKLNELCFTQQGDLNLQFTLTTINQPQLVSIANILKDEWAKIGISVNVNPLDLSELKEIIKNRDYDALLYGQALGNLPDLYPFWHSTQIKDPGLNLSVYQNKTADELLKEARESTDEEIKKQKYQKLQDVILKDAPALFLYNPDYIYWVSSKIKGIDTVKIVDPAKRFENITNWYINTKRAFK